MTPEQESRRRTAKARLMASLIGMGFSVGALLVFLGFVLGWW